MSSPLPPVSVSLPGAAEEHVVTVAADEDVVPVAAQHAVVLWATVEGVVAVSSEDEVGSLAAEDCQRDRAVGQAARVDVVVTGGSVDHEPVEQCAVGAGDAARWRPVRRLPRLPARCR